MQFLLLSPGRQWKPGLLNVIFYTVIQDDSPRQILAGSAQWKGRVKLAEWCKALKIRGRSGLCGRLSEDSGFCLLGLLTKVSCRWDCHGLPVENEINKKLGNIL